MTSKDVNDPIVAANTKNVKNDILMFKDETLKDFKEAQKKVNEKYQTLNFEVREKLDAYEQRITTYEAKIMELSKLINTDKTIRDKVDSLMEFKEKTTDTMLTEKIRLDNFRNDLNFNVDRIDDILKNSVIYPGVIGGISRYKNFHELIDYILTQISQTLTFREKSIIDLKSYKTKLDNTISSFNTQINALLNSTSEYTKTCVKECEDRMKSIYNVYDDRLQDARIENANYAIGLEKATEVLKKELENLYVVKKELYEKVDSGILEVKNDNTRVVKLFTGYKKNFHIMQHKFTQLSDFIKDIRFRINIKEDVKRREYSRMSDLINFDKKQKPGFYDGVYDTKKIFKAGFGSQLKDYIEGKITADQLFKKKSGLSKSVPMGKGSFVDKRKSTIESNFHVPELVEDSKLNFVDLLKTSLKKRLTLDQEDFNKTQNISNRDIIKEEDEDDNMSPREINGILSKTVKVLSVNKDLLEKDKDKESEKKNEKRKDSMNKMSDKNKMEDKNEKANKQKIEESKIQIVSKDKDKDKDKEKDNDKEKNKNEEGKKSEKDRSSIKNIIKDLFSVREIMDNIKNQNSNSPQKENTSNQIEKKKIIVENNNNNSNSNSNSNININNNNNNNTNNNHNNSSSNIINKKININTNNSNNINVVNNTNNSNNQNKKDTNKNNKIPVKSAVPMNRRYNKIEEQNSIRKNNMTNINNNTTINPQKNRTISTAHENKKIGVYDPRAVNVNIYNATLNPITNCIQTINKVSPKKKANSTNQKNNKYMLKQNTFNPGYNSSYRDYGSIKKEETRKLESMYNDLVSYLPRNEMNIEENNYFGYMKKK